MQNLCIIAAASNRILKLKFKKFHSKVINSVNAANILDFLFQEGVVGDEDMRTLQLQRDSRQQCRMLLTLLHQSQHPEAFVQLYCAIKEESHLQWLVHSIDEFSDKSLVKLRKQKSRTDLTSKASEHVL